MPGKREAIARVNSHIGHALLDPDNTHFASVKQAVPVWWLDIPRRKVGKQLHLLLKRTNGIVI